MVFQKIELLFIQYLYDNPQQANKKNHEFVFQKIELLFIQYLYDNPQQANKKNHEF